MDNERLHQLHSKVPIPAITDQQGLVGENQEIVVKQQKSTNMAFHPQVILAIHKGQVAIRTVTVTNVAMCIILVQYPAFGRSVAY